MIGQGRDKYVQLARIQNHHPKQYMHKRPEWMKSGSAWAEPQGTLFFCNGLGLLLGMLHVALKLRNGRRVVAGLGMRSFRAFHTLLCKNVHLKLIMHGTEKIISLWAQELARRGQTRKGTRR